jgi:hypothetical protein
MPFVSGSQHAHVPFLQQKDLALPEQLGSLPLHPEDTAEDADPASHTGGHSDLESQHFHFPLGQQMVLLPPHWGLVLDEQTRFCELAALLTSLLFTSEDAAPEEFWPEELREELFVEEFCEETLAEEMA